MAANPQRRSDHRVFGQPFDQPNARHRFVFPLPVLTVFWISCHRNLLNQHPLFADANFSVDPFGIYPFRSRRQIRRLLAALVRYLGPLPAS